MIGEETRGRKGLAEAGPRGEWAGVDGPVIGRHRVWGAPGVRPGDGVPGLDQDAPRLVGDIDDGDIGAALRLRRARAAPIMGAATLSAVSSTTSNPSRPRPLRCVMRSPPLETVTRPDLA